jgi:hypothetical protein
VVLERQVATAIASRAKIAFSTAGAATAIVGSPTPTQKPPDGMHDRLDAGIRRCATPVAC